MEPDLRAVLRRHAPGAADAELVPLGAGTGHVAVRAGELVLRRAVAGTDPDREARLLAALGPLLPLPVPRPLAVDTGVLVHPLLPGRPLLGRLPPPGAARALGGFLRVLHDLDPATLPLAEEPADPADWLDGLGVPGAPGRPPGLLDRLRADVPPPAGRLVPAHADLGAEHLLAAGGRITGVLDWSDAAVTDPALDLARPYRDFGPAFLAAMLPAYGPVDDATRRRIGFLAAATALEDLDYGAAPGREAYAVAARRALGLLPETRVPWGSGAAGGPRSRPPSR